MQTGSPGPDQRQKDRTDEGLAALLDEYEEVVSWREVDPDARPRAEALRRRIVAAVQEDRPRMVDRLVAAAELAERHGISEACASTGLLISAALRQAADEHPGLTEREALLALATVERRVRDSGVPRRAGR